MGEILIDKNGWIFVKGIYVVGDVMDVFYKQIVIVMGEGVKVVLVVFEDWMCGMIYQ